MEHDPRRWPGYASYRRLRADLLLRHIRVFGLSCPGAPGHLPHFVNYADDLTVDHIRPRSQGGTDTRDNLRIVCSAWNSSRGARPDI